MGDHVRSSNRNRSHDIRTHWRFKSGPVLAVLLTLLSAVTLAFGVIDLGLCGGGLSPGIWRLGVLLLGGPWRPLEGMRRFC
jgi:hypothetical protein